MEPFIEKKQVNEPLLLQINKWMDAYPGISAGFSTRMGGVSLGEWNSLNCALHVQDVPEHVIENRMKIASVIGFSFESWTCAEQVHGNEVYRVTLEHMGKGRTSRESAIQGKDALITNESGIWLTSFYADCVPLYFFDPVSKAVGLAHAGWKGTVSAIAKVTIQAMIDQFGSRIENVKAAIGPSIGSCCYEVDQKVIDQFRNVDLNDGIEGKDNGFYWLDLKEINRQIIIKAGIMPTNIEISTLCTACHPEYFFSYRKEKGKTGRMMSWIGLKKG